MTTFILIPGAGGSAWYWNLVAPDLIAAGHRAIAVDLPGDDENAGLEAYSEIVVDEVAERSASCSSPSRWALSPPQWSVSECRWRRWPSSTR
jgi:hypothetical protein